VASLLFACGKTESPSGDKPVEASAPSTRPLAVAPPSVGTVAPPTTASESPAAPDAGAWSTDGIKIIDPTCKQPWVILTTAPPRTPDGAKPQWVWIRQALLANREFQPVGVDSTACEGSLCFPKAAGQVHFATFDIKSTDGIMLVATCNDGGTCNRLAAMYKGIVRTAKPQLGCGKKVPNAAGEGTPTSVWSSADLPGKDDVIAQCARLAACMITVDRSTPGDPGIDCQRAPSHYKLACARKPNCADVIACTKE